jgi:AcrR family transcriptional regulator
MPQQRRAQVTRRAILVAAAEEFDHADYDATPLSAILRRGGVTKGAFYFHFESKEAVAGALVRLQNQCWQHLWRTWTGSERDPLSTMVGIVDEATRLLEEDVVIRAGMRLGRHPSVARRAGSPSVLRCERMIVELLQRSSEEGLLRGDVDPQVAARVLYAAVVGSRAISSDRNSAPGISWRVGEVWRVLLRGIASPEWLQRNPQP